MLPLTIHRFLDKKGKDLVYLLLNISMAILFVLKQPRKSNYEDFCLLFVISYACITCFTVRSHCDLENPLYYLKGCSKYSFLLSHQKLVTSLRHILFLELYLFKITFMYIYLK